MSYFFSAPEKLVSPDMGSSGLTVTLQYMDATGTTYGEGVGNTPYACTELGATKRYATSAVVAFKRWGNFVLMWKIVGPDTYIYENIQVERGTGLQSEIAVVPSTCLLTGFVYDVGAYPITNAVVSVRVLSLPTVIGGLGVMDSIISTKTDANGYFELEAMQGATLDVSIAVMSYRRTIIVPSVATADLFGI